MYVLVENELDKPTKKLTKGLTKCLINKYRILNGAKCLPSGILQNYLVFISANKYIEFFSKIQQIY